MTLNETIYKIVAQIPLAQVATYKQIAQIIGTCTARQVGYAMARCPSELPWQRVINSQGKVSVRSDGSPSNRQYNKLKQEGVIFTSSGRINFNHYGWLGPDNDFLKKHHLNQVAPAGL